MCEEVQNTTGVAKEILAWDREKIVGKTICELGYQGKKDTDKPI